MGWKLKKRMRYALIEQDTVDSRKHRGTFFIGPRHVKHHSTKEFVEFTYVENPDFASEKNCRVFAQNSHVAVEIYDYYAKLFNPDYETVSVYDERFDVQYLFKITPKEMWRSVDYYNPTIQVIPLDAGVEIKKVFDTDYGEQTLEISYIIRTGAFLKHKIVFTNKTAESKTFRVVMKLAGITNNKVKHKDGEDRITSVRHIISPFFFIGEDNQHLKLTEYLWSLGVTPEEPDGEWTSTTLKDIVFDVHTQGCKANIIIGNYALVQNESLLIDPDTDTWQVGASSDDVYGNEYYDSFFLTRTTTFIGKYDGHAIELSGHRFLNVTIPKNAEITTAKLIAISNGKKGTLILTKIWGEAADNAATFSTLVDYLARDETTASVDWDITTWTSGVSYDSPEIKTIIQEIVNRGGWVSGNALVILWKDDGSASYNCIYSRTWDYSGHESGLQLEVIWVSVVAPTVTTQNATDIGLD